MCTLFPKVYILIPKRYKNVNFDKLPPTETEFILLFWVYELIAIEKNTLIIFRTQIKIF